ncbi:MAG TPA: metal ABC transporter permease [Rhodothermales bacterium]|nr:metal ABC transporter permease [Rhodothermales bacterium]
MTDVQLEIQLVAIVVAAACALPGVFLVLRQMAMMSDAISHAILPGIVVGFFLTQDLNSPLLILAAALTGVLTVALVEALNRTRLVKEDAAMGLVFPILFSIGVILIARFAGDVHLDTDAVLLGELAFVPFDRLVIGGYDVGPKALALMSVVGIANALFILAFYKELKLATFDSGLAAALGFLPAVLHYALMALVSVTAVAAFDAVGSILVVALMVGPPAAAHLLTDRLARMIGLSVLIGVASAVGGYWMAHSLDASIAGSMATMVGVLFGAAFLLAPHRGVVAVLRRRARQRWTFAQKMLAIHLLHHENLPEAERECRVEHLQEHLQWDADFASRVVRQSVQNQLVIRHNSYMSLTAAGRELARESIVDV